MPSVRRSVSGNSKAMLLEIDLGAVPLQPAGHSGIATASAEGDEVGVGREIGRIAQRCEVPQGPDRPGGVAVQGLCGGERVDHAAVGGPECLGPPGVLQEGRQVLRLVGLDRGPVLAP